MESTVMEELLAAYPMEKLKEGSVVKGFVTAIRGNEVAVDIGGKAEGVVPALEFNDIESLEIGNEIDVYIERLEDKYGNPLISHDKALQKKNWALIIENCEEGSVLPGRVKGRVKGGLLVNIGVDAFLPASQVDTQSPINLDQYIGNTYEFKILKINQERKNIIISRRELIEEERQEKRRLLLSEIKIGDIRNGIVKNTTDYGAFVDIDGLDGLLHITDMSWGRISHPSDVVKPGQEVKVMIIGIDQEKERFSLGLKQTVPNPWDNIEQHYPIGSKVHGKVVNMVPYGVFVEIENGVEGLIHITEMSWTKRVNKPSEIVKIGQEVDAIVIEVSKDEQRIALSLKQTEENPWEMVCRNYPVGAHVRGKIRNMMAYGAFVELEEGIDGMIHVSDMSWTRNISNPNEFVKKGDEVDTVVLSIDQEQQRIALGIKQLTEDPWPEIQRKYKIGSTVCGTVTRIVPYGAFVKLEDDLEGLVHISQISETHVDKVKSVLAVGQEISARVIKIDSNDRRIGLSIKAANYDETAFSEEMRAFDKIKNTAELVSLSDMFSGIDKSLSREEEEQ
ncbi:MAG: 30S ribosomal protein S1 [Puniceicoccales bacterium]|jgi:small subunit ribosomal protein S1|nr:30S ribosomal protein S1 [Puniceicoccales bacterium]